MSLWTYTPSIFKQTKAGKPGFNWIIETLLYFLVFFVVQFVYSAIVLTIQVFLLIMNTDVMKYLTSGDIQTVTKLANDYSNSNPYLTPVSLILEVIMTIGTVAFCYLFQKRKISTVGFVKKHAVRDYAIGLVAGFAAFSLAVLFCLMTGAISISVSKEFNLLIFILFIIGWFFQGMCEEVLCRGYLLPSISRKYSIWVGVIINSLVFAAMHLGNNGISILPFINLFLFGLFASLVFIKTENIWLCSAIHTVWNFVQGNFYGILVSGNVSGTSVLTTTMNESKSLINGGSFGLEGGLGVTISMVLFSAVTFYLIYRDYKKQASN